MSLWVAKRCDPAMFPESEEKRNRLALETTVMDGAPPRARTISADAFTRKSCQVARPGKSLGQTFCGTKAALGCSEIPPVTSTIYMFNCRQ